MVGWKDRKVVNPTGEVFFLIFSKARDVGCWGSAWGNSSNPVICGASTPDGLLAAKDQAWVESLPQAKLKSTIVAFKIVGLL